jgi:cytochrome b pre-mRNA-processing protein 3
MNIYMSFYNNLVELTRNKELYKNFKSQDTFSDRLILLLIHLAFFFKVYKKDDKKKELQDIYDFIFRQLELSIREIGYGDQSINKKMKDYLNLFHTLIDRIHYWNDLKSNEKTKIFDTFLDNSSNNLFLVEYFNKYYDFLKNNTLNSYLKSVGKA